MLAPKFSRTKLRVVVLNDGPRLSLCGRSFGGRNFNTDGNGKATAAAG